ncbi:serine hydrolase [Streptomyces sp. NPDC006487]|uniref:serine hydrolase n=1 Tax=Streptomyces sp. NPDC006487 TaxID=3364748 RepID=UPI003681564A
MKRNPKPLAAAGALVLACVVAAVTPAHAAPRGPGDSTTGTASAGPVSGTVACTAGDGSGGRLAADVAAVLRHRSSRVSLEFEDHRTGTTCELGARRTFDAASTVKPIVLGTLLWTRHGEPSPPQKKLAEKMIVDSDNGATAELWKELSSTSGRGPQEPVKVREFLAAAHMDHTVPSSGGTFGLTRVTAPDLLRLLQVLRGGGGVLDPASRAYAFGLMARVRTDQRWGASAGAPEGAVVHIKNGWLQRSAQADDIDDRGDWKINSMAAVTGPGCDYDLVVLTENNRAAGGRPARAGYAYGVTTIEDVAKAVNRAEAGGDGKPAGKTAPSSAPEAAVAFGIAALALAGHRSLGRKRR